MRFDDSLEEHRLAGVSLWNEMHQGMLERVRFVMSAFASEQYCAPGRWSREDREWWDDSPELQQLMLAHASFQAIALIIEISVTQGRLADAAVMLESDALFDSATRMLADALSRFEKCQGADAAAAFTPASHYLVH